jgi:hypothetical protein
VNDLAPASIEEELLVCAEHPIYFIDSYCQIYDATSGAWIPFRLWPCQVPVIDSLFANRLNVILKARQLGLTWLVLGYGLWLILFHPAATVLLFSRRDDEAVDLLRTRLHGMYDRLPAWLKVQSFGVDNDHEWELSNGSRVLAFPTTAGDSYTGTLVIVDEADLVPDLGRLMRAVKPTIDGGGKMILLSRADKTQPKSVFKRIYAGGKQKDTEWVGLFLPWNARPDRDQKWYEAQKAEIVHRTGSLDDLYEQYPASDVEALAPQTLPEGDPCPECHFAPDDLRIIIAVRPGYDPPPDWEPEWSEQDLCGTCRNPKTLQIVDYPPGFQPPMESESATEEPQSA